MRFSSSSFFVSGLLLLSAASWADPAMAPAPSVAPGKVPSSVVAIPANRLPPDPSRIGPPSSVPELATVRAEVAQAIRLYEEVRAEQAGRIAALQKDVDAARKLFEDIQSRQNTEVALLRAEIPATKASFAKANDELGKALSLLKFSMDEATLAVQKTKDDAARNSEALAAAIKSQGDRLNLLAGQSKKASDEVAAFKSGFETSSTSLKKTLDGQQADLASMAIDVAAAKSLYASITSRQTAMDAAQTKLAGEVTTAASIIAQLNAELPKAKTQLAEVVKAHKDEEARLAAAILNGEKASKKLVDDAAAAAKGYESARTAQASEYAQLQTNVNAVRDGFKKRADEITAQMNGVQLKLDNAAKERSDAVTALSTIRADIAEATKGLPETMASIASFKSELAEARSLYAGIITKQNELTAFQKGLDDSIKVLARNQNARVSDFNAQAVQLETLKADLAATQGKIGETKNDLASVDSRLQTIDRTSRSTITGALATTLQAPASSQGASVCDQLRGDDPNAWAAAVVRVLPQHSFEEVDRTRNLVWAVRNGTSEGFQIDALLKKLGCTSPA